MAVWTDVSGRKLDLKQTIDCADPQHLGAQALSQLPDGGDMVPGKADVIGLRCSATSARVPERLG